MGMPPVRPPGCQVFWDPVEVLIASHLVNEKAKPADRFYTQVEQARWEVGDRHRGKRVWWT